MTDEAIRHQCGYSIIHKGTSGATKKRIGISVLYEDRQRLKKIAASQDVFCYEVIHDLLDKKLAAPVPQPTPTARVRFLPDILPAAPVDVKKTYITVADEILLREIAKRDKTSMVDCLHRLIVAGTAPSGCIPVFGYSSKSEDARGN